MELILVDSPHLTQCWAATGWIRFLALDWGSLCWKWVMSFSVLGGAVTQRAWRLISYGKKRVDGSENETLINSWGLLWIR